MMPSDETSVSIPLVSDGEKTVKDRPRRARVRRMRRWLAWTSLTRNIFASIKDGGLIALITAIIFFHDDVLIYLHNNNFAFLPIFNSRDFKRNLDQLNFSADTMPERDESHASAGADTARRTRALDWLTSEDGAILIGDWAVVLAAQPNRQRALEDAQEVKRRFDYTARVVENRRTHVVVMVGTAEKARELMQRAQSMGYPYATPVSFSSWCKWRIDAGEVTDCRKPSKNFR